MWLMDLKWLLELTWMGEVEVRRAEGVTAEKSFGGASFVYKEG